jgi:hypothetical protein
LLAQPAQAAPGTPLNPPKWSALTPQQQQVLAPLSKDWDGMESFRRKKWLGIAQRYPTMTPEQQQRVSTQMKTWAAMTPAQRNLARETYKKLNKAPPAQREAVKEKWQQYNQLSEAEKEKLKQRAAKKNALKHSGHATAPRPLTHPAPSAVPALSGTAAAR